MQRKFLKTSLLNIIFFIFGIIFWEYLRPFDLYNTGISDEEYVKIAKKST